MFCRKHYNESIKQKTKHLGLVVCRRIIQFQRDKLKNCRQMNTKIFLPSNLSNERYILYLFFIFLSHLGNIWKTITKVKRKQKIWMGHPRVLFLLDALTSNKKSKLILRSLCGRWSLVNLITLNLCKTNINGLRT